MMDQGRGFDLAGITALCFRLFLGIMFAYAAITKIQDPAGFAQAIANYRILPLWGVNGAAILLPWVELLAGACLISGLLLPGGSLLIAGLLLVFAVALGIDLWRGLDISCGCFGASSGTVTWLYVLRDTLLAAMACIVWIFSHRSPLSLDGLVSRKRA
jgi:uncharacterized membrane protein YphA (DoxX/SURF4 family)